MFLCVLGTPSGLTYWCVLLLRTLLDVVRGTHTVVSGLSIEDLRRGISDSPRRNIVFVSECPDRNIVDLLESRKIPVILVAEDPLEAFTFAAEMRGLESDPCLRFITQSICCIEPLMNANYVLKIEGATWLEKPSRAAMLDIARFYSIKLSHSQLDEIATRMNRAAAMDSDSAGPVKAQIASIFPFCRSAHPTSDILRRILCQYETVLAGELLDDLFWPSHLLIDWIPKSSLDGPIEMLGPARFIICGPYLHLPRGNWVIQIEFEVADNYSGNRLGIDVFSGRILSEVDFDLPSNGTVQCELSFFVNEPQLPVEIRVQILHGAIEGKLMLTGHHVLIRRVSGAETTRSPLSVRQLPHLAKSSHSPSQRSDLN